MSKTDEGGMTRQKIADQLGEDTTSDLVKWVMTVPDPEAFAAKIVEAGGIRAFLNEPGKTWRELMPDGRHIFYEGEDPAAWIDKIRHDFGLDPLRFEVRMRRRGNEIVSRFYVPDPAGFIRHGHGALSAKSMLGDEWPPPGGVTFTVSIDCPPALLDEIYTSDEYGPMGS